MIPHCSGYPNKMRVTVGDGRGEDNAEIDQEGMEVRLKTQPHSGHFRDWGLPRRS